VDRGEVGYIVSLRCVKREEEDVLSSKRETRYASEASWSAPIALDWNRLFVSLSQVSGGRRSLQISLEILCDLSDKSLEGEFSDQQLGRSVC
jgi:hypothetical protein